MCSQPDIFAPVCDLVPLLAIVWRDSTFCLICFWWNTMQGTILLAFRIIVARSKIRQKKEKQYWIYIVISSSSSPPPPKQDQWYLKPFLTEGNLSFPVVLSTPNRRILVLARVMQLCQATQQQDFDFLFLEKWSCQQRLIVYDGCTGSNIR